MHEDTAMERPRTVRERLDALENALTELRERELTHHNQTDGRLTTLEDEVGLGRAPRPGRD